MALRGVGTARSHTRRTCLRPAGGRMAVGRTQSPDSRNSRDARSFGRWRIARSRRRSTALAAASRLPLPALLLQPGLGGATMKMQRTLVVFALGVAVALFAGWVGFPHVLYVQKHQP